MALPNKPVGELKAVRDPEVEEREVDVSHRWRWYGCLRYRI
jgi:hypothetical protein